MRKLVYKIFLVLLCISYAHTSKAFVWFDYTPLIPVAPQICAMCTPSAITEVATAIDQVEQMRQKFEKYKDISKIKQALVSYATGIGVTVFNNLRQKLTSKNKVVSTSILLDKKMKVNLNSADEVKDVMEDRFLQYPSKKNSIKAMYQAQGEQLKIDTTIEVYVTVRKLEKELNEQLVELDKIEKCIVGGQDCSGLGMEQYNCQKDGQEDEVCLWNNNLKVANIYDSIMRNIEYLGILEAQYQAVMAIGRRPEILEYIEEETKEKKSSAIEIIPTQDFARQEISWQMSFAQQIAADDNRYAEDWFEGNEKKEAVVTEDDFEMMDGTGGFEGAMAGKKEDFLALPIIEKALEQAEMAKRAHNMKQNLRGAKKVFDSYEDMLKYHDKIVENLRISEKCIQNYMREYYQNPLKSWVGKDCGYYNQNIYCHYSPEKSIKDKQPSKGMLDIACPGMEKYKCYLLEMTDTSERFGLSGYTLGLYLEARKQEALQDQDAYLLEDEGISNKIAEDSSVNNQGYITTLDRETSSDDPNDETNASSQDDIDRAANADRDSYDAGTVRATMKKPSLEESMEAEARKNGLLNWTIGAVVSKAMVDDLHGAPFSFGAKKNNFPLWNDQQEFYDQYIDGKYENIKEYFEKEPFTDILLEVAHQINAEYEYEEDPLKDLRVEDSEALKDLEDEVDDEIKKDEQRISEIDKAIAAEKKELAVISKKYKDLIEKKRQEIKFAYNRLDDYSAKLDEAQKAYNDANGRVRGSKQTTPRNTEGIEIGEEMYADRSESLKSDKPSPIDEDFSDNNKANEETGSKGLADRGTAKINVETNQAKVTQTEQEIKQLKKDIEKLRSEYVRAYSNKLSEKKQQIDMTVAQRREEGLTSFIAGRSGDIIALSAAQSALQCVRQYAVKKVDEAMEKIKEMQDSYEIYSPSNIGKVRNIHNNMIKEITQDMDIEEVLKSSDCNLDQDILDIVMQSSMIEAMSEIFAQLCKDDYCTTPEADDVYFVGSQGKRRDFKTPTAPVNFASAPLREIFHFDMGDYDNVDKYTPYDDDDEDADLSDNKLVTITGESFLSLGGDLPFIYDPENIARNEGMMPKIWYYILKPLAFEEREFDLLKLVSRGAPSQAYLRSGTYPCLIDGHFVRTAEDFLLSFVQKDDNMRIQECRGIKLEQGKNGVIWPCDIESGVCGHCDTTNRHCKFPPEDLVDDSSASSSSELAAIIDYIPDPDFEVYNPFFKTPIPQRFPRYKLTFNPMLQKAVEIVNNYKDEEDENNGQYHGARRSFLDRNQFGDYLDNIDTEAKATEVMANLSKKIMELEDNLEEIFNAFGYTLKGVAQTEDGKEVEQVDGIGENFSLLNQSDYKLALDTLESFKENYMRSSESALKTVPVEKDKATEHVKGEYDKVDHTLKVLKKDVDEDVLISGDEDLEDLQEKIKEGKANQDIGDEYEKKRKEDLEDKIKRLPAPYCSVYLK